MSIRSGLTVAAAAALCVTFVSSQAQAWHHGEPHRGYHHGPAETYVERRSHRDRYVEDDDHHVSRHRHCREVEFHDHHGRHRIRTVCR